MIIPRLGQLVEVRGQEFRYGVATAADLHGQRTKIRFVSAASETGTPVVQEDFVPNGDLVDALCSADQIAAALDLPKIENRKHGRALMLVMTLEEEWRAWNCLSCGRPTIHRLDIDRTQMAFIIPCCPDRTCFQSIAEEILSNLDGRR